MLPKFHFTIERWKYNPTFELYVSNMGHIRNKSKADIAPRVTKNGYMTVKVNGSINKHMLLHRVVMLTWKPTPEAEKLTVDHLDHNKRNNALSNLEWVLKEENLRRANEDLVSAYEVVDYHYVESIELGAPSLKNQSSHLLITINSAQQRGAFKGPYHIDNTPAAIDAFIKYASQFATMKNLKKDPNLVAKLKKRIASLNKGAIAKAEYIGMTITTVFDAPAANNV
jgi:hypothetical protein